MKYNLYDKVTVYYYPVKADFVNKSCAVIDIINNTNYVVDIDGINVLVPEEFLNPNIDPSDIYVGDFVTFDNNEYSVYNVNKDNNTLTLERNHALYISIEMYKVTKVLNKNTIKESKYHVGDTVFYTHDHNKSSILYSCNEESPYLGTEYKVSGVIFCRDKWIYKLNGYNAFIPEENLLDEPNQYTEFKYDKGRVVYVNTFSPLYQRYFPHESIDNFDEFVVEKMLYIDNRPHYCIRNKKNKYYNVPQYLVYIWPFVDEHVTKLPDDFFSVDMGEAKGFIDPSQINEYILRHRLQPVQFVPVPDDTQNIKENEQTAKLSLITRIINWFKSLFTKKR